jgi:hypothetical protein
MSSDKGKVIKEVTAPRGMFWVMARGHGLMAPAIYARCLHLVWGDQVTTLCGRPVEDAASFRPHLVGTGRSDLVGVTEAPCEQCLAPGGFTAATPFGDLPPR